VTTLTNSFAGGTSGVTISTGNSGGASGSAFDSVVVGSGGTAQFSNAQAAHGGLAALVQTTTANSTNVAWSTSMGSQSQVWFRLYMYFASLPSAATRFFSVVNGGGTGCARFQVTTSGNLQVLDGTGTQITFSTATIPAGQWFRVEGFAVLSASVGQTQVSLYTVPDGTTAVETDTSAASQNTLGAPVTYAFGPATAVANQGPFYMDDIGLSNTGPLGPFGYPYYGDETLDYLDYLDVATGKTLVAVPGGTYAMQVVNSRAGLTVPPPDNRWGLAT